ncbi:MAG: hydroxymethylglutaryl-CoA lyase [Rhizobiales bacterium]|nr:hydroxymethylglutaryl-CoA lyase [Hyphomicrobiales bacterium]
MAEPVTICEVAPRDGLQNEAAFVATEDKVRLIDLLSATGVRYIEAARRRSGVVYAALTPNLKGYEAAMTARANEVAVFAAASESFSRRNINCSIEESLVRYRDVCRAAERDGMPVRGYVSCAIACPYEGPVVPEAVCRLAVALLDMGCREISLGDTIGVAWPEQVEMLLDAVLRQVPAAVIAGHFHDTHGRARACIRKALELGIRVFDTSAGGTGGCPFAPGARGNVATEKVVQMLSDEGYETGIDMGALEKASALIAQLLGRPA